MTKYQIFISSTYDDLKEERSQIIKAILEMGHIPVGMEMFSAADEEQWRIISRQIEETDYYVVVAGNRYGSTVDGISYTEKEYEYALLRGIPVLGFVIDPSVEPLAKDTDMDVEKAKSLAIFKSKIKQRPVSFWRTPEDLHGKVSISLMKAFNTNPRYGWIKSGASVGSEVASEISRLSRENAELRLQLEQFNMQKKDDDRSALRHVLATMKSIPVELLFREEGKLDWDVAVQSNLYEIFRDLAPEMMIEISVGQAAGFLGVMNKPRDSMKLSRIFPLAANHMQLLFIDFSSLYLVEPSKKKHPVADKEAYWSLTEKGIDVLKFDRALALERAASGNS